MNGHFITWNTDGVHSATTFHMSKILSFESVTDRFDILMEIETKKYKQRRLIPMKQLINLSSVVT